jgi:2-polyprenyl-3-methyl-5-hydroxy-6-metoxy-1,4-benzoquinol methylase
MSFVATVKSTIKSLVPTSAIHKFRQFRLRPHIDAYKSMDNNQARFDKVYTDLVWQEGTDSTSPSGDGSFGLWLDESVKYIADSKFLEGRTALEIGCGDFSFGSKIASLANQYTAGDVSSVIIGKNKQRYADLENVNFVQLDATSAELPKADVVIIRQVLQHLPNNMILDVLKQVEKMGPAKVIVFEDVPAEDFEPNLDLETAGPYTRHLVGSGVNLSKPPFNRDFRQTKDWLHPRHPQVPARLVCYELN